MREASRRDSDSRGTRAGAGGRVDPAGAVLPGRGAPSSLSRPLFPPQLSRRVGSEGTVEPGGLRACRERSRGFRGCLEGRGRKERRIKGLESRRGHDPRAALGAERVPGFHLHLEQARRPAGTVRPRAREPASAEGVGGPEPVRGEEFGGRGRGRGRGRVPGRRGTDAGVASWAWAGEPRAGP